jgi:hypothetical protein
LPDVCSRSRLIIEYEGAWLLHLDVATFQTICTTSLSERVIKLKFAYTCRLVESYPVNFPTR